ncbi:MAG: potassium channel family protein [Acidobacteria bacterium]|jgi:hypothetical protein|nr:potassium channel family protein [Acidobacteriota bacterium]
MSDKKPSQNEVLKIVEEAKEHEKNDRYYEAHEKFLQASESFKEINEFKLSARCFAAQAINLIKYYVATRDIEGFAINFSDFCIKQINNEIMDFELDKLNKYDILISTYRELEKTFAGCHLADNENEMYYKKTELSHKQYWQRSKQKNIKYIKKKISDKVFSLINFLLFIFCGHGEKPVRAFSGIAFFIFLFSIIFKCFNLIEFVDPEKTLCYWQSLYFSFVTFTTLGYGDIVPINITGQIIVILEVTLGVMSLGLLLATLTRKFTK